MSETCRDTERIRRKMSGYILLIVRVGMSNWLINTYNYFCKMIVSGVIRSCCGYHGERNNSRSASSSESNFFKRCNVMREQGRRRGGRRRLYLQKLHVVCKGQHGLLYGSDM